LNIKIIVHAYNRRDFKDFGSKTMKAIKWTSVNLPKAIRYGVDEVGYVAPFRVVSDGIEGIDWFASENSLLKHIVRYPYIMDPWDTLFERLKAAGWRSEDDASEVEAAALLKLRPLLGSNEAAHRWRYFFSPSIDNMRPSLTVFRSAFSLMMHVSRFPYALQEDCSLVEMLAKSGWAQSGENRWSHPHRSPLPKTLSDVRKMLWDKPSLISLCGVPCISNEDWFM
jgi:hypothetical protein